MFPIAVIVRGSHVFGELEGDDVDLFIPYVASTAQTFKGAIVDPKPLKEGALDLEVMEIGTIVRSLASGDSKVLLSLLSPGQISYTPWYLQLKTILYSYLSTEFGESLLKYIDDLETSTERADKYAYIARYINFGMGYFNDQNLVIQPVTAPEGGFTKEWYEKAREGLVAAIEGAKSIEKETEKGVKYKLYDHNTLVSNLVAWLMAVRSQVFKIEDGIL